MLVHCLLSGFTGGIMKCQPAVAKLFRSQRRYFCLAISPATKGMPLPKNTMFLPGCFLISKTAVAMSPPITIAAPSFTQNAAIQYTKDWVSAIYFGQAPTFSNPP
jgi:hypothetical protein